MGRLAGCNRCDSWVHLDPGGGDISDYLLDCRGRLSDFVFRVDVRRLVWVAPEAKLTSFFEFLKSLSKQLAARQVSLILRNLT